MRNDRELEILFPTSFSDSCFRIIPAVAQFVDELRARVTLLHVYDRRKSNRVEAEEQLQSFFAEAEHYGACRRIVTDGDAVEVVEKFSKQERVDLIVAPSSDRIGLPRIGHRSFRARLLQNVPIPLWTAGPLVEKGDFSRTIRNVACWVDFDSPNIAHLRTAAALAMRVQARLHIVHAVPAVHEGILATMLNTDRPLHPSVAMERIEQMTGWMPIRPEVHVSIGDDRRELPRLIRNCGADILFAGENQALRRGTRRPQMHPLLNAIPCPTVCFDGASKMGVEWPFDRREAELRAPMLSPALVPARS